MEERATRIEEIFHELEEQCIELDSVFLVFVDGLTNEVTSILSAKQPVALVSSICEMMEHAETDQRGRNVVELFMSVILSYCKMHPKFATNFIQQFNKAMYGIDF